MTDLQDAWDETPRRHAAGWYVGQPSYHDERNEWVMYAFDPSERAVMGKRPEWTAVAPTEEAVLREMARCLGEVGEGRWPK